MLIRLLICLAAGTLFFPLIFGCITVPLKAAPETKVKFHGEEGESGGWMCFYTTPADFECVPFEVFMSKYLGLQQPSSSEKL